VVDSYRFVELGKRKKGKKINFHIKIIKSPRKMQS